MLFTFLLPIDLVSAVVIAVFVVVISGVLASNKRRTVGGWVTLAILLGWPVPILLACMSKLSVEDSPLAAANHGVRKCPFCAEEIRAEAVKCKHCGSDVSPLAPPPAPPAPPHDPGPPPGWTRVK